MRKVYIVDDDQSIVESISMVLESEKYEVKSQNDENNLIDNLKSFAPDAIILDVMFPENSSAGFEMAREIKQESSISNIPIIMLSAINEKNIYPGKWSNKDKDENWLPVDEFIEKPIAPNALLDKLNTLIK